MTDEKLKITGEEALDDVEASTEDVMSAVWDNVLEDKGIPDRGEEDGLQEQEQEEEEKGREEKPVVDDEAGEEEKKELPISLEEEDEIPSSPGETIEDGISHAQEFDPPPGWSDDAKEEFGALPPKQQEQLVQMQRGMQSDFQKAVNGVSGIVQALDPIKDECIKYGLKYEDAVRKFVGIHKQLLEDPAAGMRTVMSTYGVTPDQILGIEEDDGMPPQARDRIAALEQKVDQTTQGMQQQQMAAIDQSVEAFKNGPGKEFYDAVEQDMIVLVNSHQQMGRPVPPIQELYDTACWANPQVRAKLLAKQNADKTTDKIEKRKESVARSRRAARTVSRGSSGRIEEKEAPTSLHDVLSQTWDDAEKNRARGGR